VRCGQRFGEALTGKVDPLSLLFPGGSLSLAVQLYSESSEARVFNSLVCDAVKKAFMALPEGRKVKILELGAGTGGATSFVLPGLPADRAEYFFTDISPVFLRKGAERFKAFNFLTYQLCDIERGPEEQGFKSRSFDVVIAMNMLHATVDLRRSLENVHRFLSAGGLLILLEGTAPERWIDITFGLTDGWWAFKDTELRPSYPLLTRQQWKGVLSSTGFEDAMTVPESSSLSQQAIIIARKPLAEVKRIERSDAGEGYWLIFSDQGGIGSTLAERLEGKGKPCVVVLAGQDYKHASPKNWTIAADRPGYYHRLIEELHQNHITGFKGVVHLWSLESTPPSTETIVSLEPAQILGCGSLLYLLQAMATTTDWSRSSRLFIVTKGAQGTGMQIPMGFYQAPVWGLGKVIALEHPDLNCCCIDLDPETNTTSQTEQLLQEILFSNEENLVSYRAGRRVVPRLNRVRGEGDVPGRPVGVLADGQSFRLQKSSGGVLEDILLVPTHRCAPLEGQVEIQVHTIGLGFKDVLNALAMLDDPDPLGFECSGHVVALGEGVDHLAVGDEVIALAPGSFATHVVTDARFVLAKPPALSFEEAATLPVSFLTAHYALNHIGKISAGEKILIHAAAGGVGMAAVQLALNAGAVVFGTAGNTEKRSSLASLGVQHVMDSRSLNFSTEIMQKTEGRGVDVVLNSLSGDFISRSLSTLAPGGRFLEIGRRGILTPEEAFRLRPDIQYHVIDLTATTRQDPRIAQRLLKEIMTLRDQGVIRPLPLTSFTLSRAADAFRYMAQAKHIGRIVVTNDVVQTPFPEGKIRSDRTYIVTGGFSGLGLLVARWLVEKGARHLALIGRSPASENAKATISEMKEMGARVLTIQADVSLREGVASAFEEIKNVMPPIRGIIHSAGILADGVLLKQDWDRFRRVMAPKIDGAWNLHVHSCHLPLDFFILFSSTAGLLGSAGQGNHAAANAFLDALAHYRHSQGLPALSINWGVWSEVGSAAEHRADERVALQGVESIRPEKGLEALEKAMKCQGPQVVVVPIDWRRFLPLYAGGVNPPWLSKMRPGRADHLQKSYTTGTRNQQVPELLQKLRAESERKRMETLQAFIINQTRSLLGVDSDASIDPEKPLSEQGLDSLMAVELRNLLRSSLGLKQALPATLVFDYPTISDLATFVDTRLMEGKGETSPGATSKREEVTSESPRALDQIEQLSDDEIDRLLANKIQQEK
jgi:NADPH:quinone reductase-like Zn-dependent oxidoreductase/SAM-dependent methyltransferase/acyl carrier protein